MSNHPPPSSEVLEHAASVALHLESRAVQYAQDEGYYTADPSEATARFVAMDGRYASWPGALLRARRVAFGTSKHYGAQFWRMHTGMGLVEFDATLSEDEQHLTQGLLDTITWSRAQERPVDNGARSIATAESALNEYGDLVYRLGSIPIAPYRLQGVTWNSLVHKLVTNEIQLGSES